MIDARVVSVHVGRAAPLGPKNVLSAFIKRAVEGPVMVGPLGLDGDEQADLNVHGGSDKAVYGYAASHYAAWAVEFPALASKFAPGGVGENLAIEGMDEWDICVGDVHAIGETLLQVCQPRQPCFKFALRFNNNRLPRAMVRNGRSGWYYHVVQPGQIAAGDRVTLQARPNPDFPFARLVELVNRGKATGEELRQLAEMEGLAQQWRDIARQSL
jgi:MOSC domain-containing protein YiiM